jgi:hypothetical protein
VLVRHAGSRQRGSLYTRASRRPKLDLRTKADQDGINCRRMLEVVRKTWIDGDLKNSLHDLARIELGLEENAPGLRGRVGVAAPEAK